MTDILIVVDMQNDFIDGALGTKEAVGIVPFVKAKIEAFEGDIYYTRDTHGTNYMATREGKFLPVPHCINGTNGWEISGELPQPDPAFVIDKPTFGSLQLAEMLKEKYGENMGSITLVGLCTDICVISNAMILKAAFPETDIIVDAQCCAGVTPKSHREALGAMSMCQIIVANG